MRKDIRFPEVKGVSVVAVPEEEKGIVVWKIHLVNENPYPLDNVLVTSKGYGEVDGEPRNTSILRHALGRVNPVGAAQVEVIQEELFGFTNEYWVSYFVAGQLFDKKFYFDPWSIDEGHLKPIPILNKEGVKHSR